jgi:hypothetical protein
LYVTSSGPRWRRVRGDQFSQPVRSWHPLAVEERAQRAAVRADVREHGLGAREARLPERRQRDAVIEVEGHGQRLRIAGLQVLRVQQRVAREPADVCSVQRRLDDRQRLGAGNEASTALDLQDSVEHEIDDVACIFSVAEERAVETRRRGQRAEELRGLPRHRLQVHGQRRLRDEQSVELRVALQLPEPLALLGRQIAELPQLDVRAGPKAEDAQGIHGWFERRLPVPPHYLTSRFCICCRSCATAPSLNPALRYPGAREPWSHDGMHWPEGLQVSSTQFVSLLHVSAAMS